MDESRSYSPLAEYLYGGLDAAKAEIKTLDKSWQGLFRPTLTLFDCANFSSDSGPDHPNGQMLLRKMCRILHFLAQYGDAKLELEEPIED